MFSRANRLGSYFIVFCVTTATLIGVLLVSPTLLADPQSKAPETKFDPKQPKTHGALLRDGERMPIIPIGPRLRKELKKRNFETLALINGTGQVKIVNLFGVDVAPCGQVEGTQLIGNCELKGVDLLNHNVISIFVVKSGTVSKILCRVNDILIPCP